MKPDNCPGNEDTVVQLQLELQSWAWNSGKVPAHPRMHIALGLSPAIQEFLAPQSK